jgi:hypothetical protein
MPHTYELHAGEIIVAPLLFRSTLQNDIHHVVIFRFVFSLLGGSILSQKCHIHTGVPK